MNLHFKSLIVLIFISIVLSCFWSYKHKSFVQSHALQLPSESFIPLSEAQVQKSDFSFLDTLVQGKDLICLGEAQHGEGTSVAIRAQMIDYLRRKHGFEVLLFEAPLDPFYASTLKGTRDLKQDVAWWFWGNVKETEALQYLYQNQQLDVSSFDMQLDRTGDKIERKYTHLALIKSQLSKHNLDTLFLEHIQTPYRFNTPEKLDHLKQTCLAIQDTLSQKPEGSDLLLAQLVMNLYWDTQKWFLDNKEDKTEGLNRRDSVMAANVITLKERLFKTKKVIVWAANFHTSYQNIQSEHPNFTPMGYYLKQKYGKRIYSIFFTAYEGKVRDYKDSKNVYSISEAPVNSLESALSKQGLDYAFINLNQFPYKGIARAIGYGNIEDQWNTKADALFFMNTLQEAHLLFQPE